MLMSGEFVIWAFVMLGVLTIGLVAIATTTLNPLGRKIPFPEPITGLSIPISGEAQVAFQNGLAAYRVGRYGKAIEYFNDLITQERACAEAFHNRGLAHANLAKNQLALPDFLKASELYDQQGTKAGIDQIKVDLEVLAG